MLEHARVPDMPTSSGRKVTQTLTNDGFYLIRPKLEAIRWGRDEEVIMQSLC